MCGCVCVFMSVFVSVCCRLCPCVLVFSWAFRVYVCLFSPRRRVPCGWAELFVFEARADSRNAPVEDRQMGKRTAKQAGGGVAKAAPKAIAVKRARREDVYVDDETKAKRAKVKNDLQEKRQHKSKGKTVEVGFECVGDVAFAQDLDEIIAWAKSLGNNKFVPFLHSLIRNGHIERAFAQQQVRLPEVLGARLVSETNCRWRHIGGMASARLVAHMLGRPEVLEWFKGRIDEKLGYEIAKKMLMYMLAVSDSTPMPANHAHAAYEVPLMWLCKKRWQEVGKRLQKVTKDTADSSSDYWVLSSDGSAVQATFSNNDPVNLPFALTIASDFVIMNAHSYTAAQLISDTVGADQNIARAWQRVHAAPKYDEEFHFPDKTSLNATDLDFEQRGGSGSNFASGSSSDVPGSTAM